LSEHTEEPEPTASRTRRNVLAAGVAGAAAVAAAGAVRPRSATAAPGQPVILGASNSSGSLGTTIVAASSAPAVTVRNTGAGAGTLMTSVNSNGFAGGAYSPNRYGVSAANYSTVTGSGSAIAASGGANDGILTSTTEPTRAALVGNHLGTELGEGAGVIGYGANIAGMVAATDSVDDYALWAIGNGGLGMVAFGTSNVAGDLFVEGDLYVTGTIFCDNAIQPLPTTALSGAGSKLDAARDRAKSFVARFRDRG
jgi:hypothetical protein